MNRLKQFNEESLYIIDTDGGQIGFDITDINLDLKIQAMYDNFIKAQSTFKANALVIQKQDEGKLDKLGISARSKAILNLQRDTIAIICKGIDDLFGDGASDKIFYHSTLQRPLITLERIIFFLEELLPEQLENAGVKGKAYIKKRTSKEEREKFVDKEDSDILEVE